MLASVASPAATEKLTEALLLEMAASRLPDDSLAVVLGALFGGQLWDRSDVRLHSSLPTLQFFAVDEANKRCQAEHGASSADAIRSRGILCRITCVLR